MTSSNLPEDIFEAAKVIKELQDKTYKTKIDLDNLNRAKLRIAFWACRSENIVASRENLTYVLGADAKDIMAAYDRYLERESDKKGKKTKSGRFAKPDSGGTSFWENA